MLSRNKAQTGSKSPRTSLDAAVIASILAMGTLNLVVMADQIGPARAFAATPCYCGSIAGIALA